eukprot:6213006-Pleurochrysis_carterae.AAC.1
MAFKFDTFREGEAKFPPFKPEKMSAVEFLKAALDSTVGTGFTLTQHYTVIGCGGACWQRVPIPHANTFKYLGAVLIRTVGSNG